MEAREYGLTRGTCFVACRHDVVAVSGLWWIPWRVLGAARFFAFVRVFFPSFFSFERTRSAESMRPPCLIFLSTSTGVRTGCHYLISLPSVCLCVCQCVCVTLVVFTDYESCTSPISTNPGFTETGEYGLTRGTCLAARRLEMIAVAGLPWVSWWVLGAAGFRFLSICFSLKNAHGLLPV